MKKVILDVDTGIDDAIAIMLAVGSKDIDLIGITTLSGNIEINKATINTLRVLKILGREDIKVYKGAEKPLERELVDASHIHGPDGLAGQLKDIEVKYNNKKSAFEFLESSINKYGDNLNIIMTGPETNLAKLFLMKPELTSKVKNVIAMGGAIEVHGNKTPTGEFNIVTDPEAAYNCFNSKIENFTLVSLDVTMKALITKEDLNLINNRSTRNIVYGFTKAYMERYFKKFGVRGCPMHDPLTVLYLINPNIITIEKQYVTVERSGEFTRGMTVCDYNSHLNRKANINICKKIDVELFKKEYFKILNQLKINN
ncbi:MAG: nucleoside hydrolase [Bacillota bacterium]|nr:nucleoside hydrolase [Bacillota bacterium]